MNTVYGLDVSSSTYFNPSRSNVTYHFLNNVTLSNIEITNTSLIINNNTNITILANQSINITIMSVASEYNILNETNGSEYFILNINNENKINASYILYNLSSNIPSNIIIGLQSIFDTGDRRPTFNFTVTNDQNLLSSCVLYIDGISAGYNNSVINNTITQIRSNRSLLLGYHTAYINCTDNTSAINKSNIISFNIITSDTSSGSPGYIIMSKKIKCDLSFNTREIELNPDHKTQELIITNNEKSTDELVFPLITSKTNIVSIKRNRMRVIYGGMVIYTFSLIENISSNYTYSENISIQPLGCVPEQIVLTIKQPKWYNVETIKDKIIRFINDLRNDINLTSNVQSIIDLSNNKLPITIEKRKFNIPVWILIVLSMFISISIIIILLTRKKKLYS